MSKKITYSVRNWKAYNRSLINRGNLTIWFSEDDLRNNAIKIDSKSDNVENNTGLIILVKRSNDITKFDKN